MHVSVQKVTCHTKTKLQITIILISHLKGNIYVYVMFKICFFITREEDAHVLRLDFRSTFKLRVRLGTG